MSEISREEMLASIEKWWSVKGYSLEDTPLIECQAYDAIRNLIQNRPKVSRELLYQWGNKLSLRQYNHPELMNEILPAMLREAGVEGEKEEEPKQYRCENCGKRFDKKLFSHSRTEESISGDNMVEVECGPITEIEDE